MEPKLAPSRARRGSRTRIAATVAVAALALTGCGGIQGGGGESGTLSLQFNSFLGPSTPQALAIDSIFTQVEEGSEGSVAIERFWGGALVAGPDTLGAVAQDRVDIGHMTVLYNPAELPLSQVIGIPFVTQDNSNVASIFTELYETNDAYRAEWESQGVVPIYFIGVPASAVGGPTPITGPEWFAGKDIRSTGYVAAALQQLGANPVALQSTEVYEAIQRGTVDGWANNILDTAIGDQSLQEVAPWVADAGTGLYTVNALVMSTSQWESLTDEQRTLFEDLRDTLNDEALSELEVLDDAACDLLIEAGGGATEWDAEQVQAWSDIVGDSALDSWRSDVTSAGVDADAFYDQYMQLIEEQTDPDFVDGISRCAERSPQP